MPKNGAQIEKSRQMMGIVNSRLKASTLRIQSQLAQFEKSLMLNRSDWSPNFIGFAKGLELAGFLPNGTAGELEKIAHHETLRRQSNRDARVELEFSVDLFTRSESGDVRKYQLDATGINPTDAYAKLSRRGLYSDIGSIELVQIFLGYKAERIPGQKAVKIFGRAQVIANG